jgi:hypothetical protein
MAMKTSPDAKAAEPETAEPKRVDTAASVAARMDILIAGLPSATPSRVEAIHDSLVIEMKNLRVLVIP